MDVTRIVEVLKSDATPLIRTDFADDTAWQRIVSDVSKPVDFDNPANLDPGDEGYSPNIDPVDDQLFEGVVGEALGAAWTDSDAVGYVLLADAQSMAEARGAGEVTIAYVDLSVSDPEDAELFESFMGRTFRCVVPEVASIEANLSIANMDFHEFADSTEPDGVFRGFPVG